MLRSLPVLLALVAFAAVASGCQDASASADTTSLPAVPEVDISETEVSGTLPYYEDRDFTPHWFHAPAKVPADFHTIPPFSLTDQQGRTVTEADLDGHLTVANFFFTACPGICPMTTANMKRVQDAFADDDDVLLVSHSITPDADSVAALQAFAAQTGVLADRWRLVTGTREAIYALGKDAYFADDDLGETVAAPDAAFTHTESFYLLDGERRIRGIYNGMNSAAVTQLIEDIQTLQRETS